MRQTISIAALAAANVLLSFAFLSWVLAHFGASFSSDAFFASALAPQLVTAVVTGSVAIVAIPFLANQDEEGRRTCSWQLIRIAALAMLVLATGLALAAPWWVPLTVPGFEASVQTLSIDLTRIQVLSIIPGIVAALCASAENARHRFLWVEASGALAGIASLITLVLLAPRYGIYGAAWAATLRPAFHATLLLPRLGPYSKGQMDSETRRLLWSRLRPLVYGSAYYKTDMIVDRVLASLAPTGGLTLLYTAQQIYAAGSAVVSRAVSSPALPLLANHARDSEWHAFNARFARRAIALLLLSISTLLLFAIAGKASLHMIASGTRFGPEEVSALWWLLLALGGMWIGGNLGSISTVAYYAKGDTLTPTRLTIVTFTVYVPLKIIAFLWFGLPGLAASISAFYLLNAMLQLALLKR
jgi:putative peptidoglycan lipid II flippase